MKIPESGLVYDYRLDDGGLSDTGHDDDDDKFRGGEVSFDIYIYSFIVSVCMKKVFAPL